MAGSFNKITLVGYLGNDPEGRFLPSGDQVTNFNVATTERWKTQSGEQQERTSWFRCAAFGRLAEQCSQLLRKGSYVYVDGRLSVTEYTNREGQPRTSLDVRCAEMRILDRLENGADPYQRPAPTGVPAPGSTLPPAASADMDDIPF